MSEPTKDEQLAKLRKDRIGITAHVEELCEEDAIREKLFEEKDKTIKEMETTNKETKAELSQTKSELNQTKAALRQKEEENDLLKRKLAELQRVPVNFLDSAVAGVSLSALPSSSSVQILSVQKNIFADYELQPNSLVEHYNSYITEAEQELVTIFNQFGREQAEADQTIKQLEERIMEKEAEAKCRICLKHEFEGTGGTNASTKTYRHIGTQTTEVRASNSWTFVILMIVLFGTFALFCIILYQIRTIQNAVTLHYVRGPPPA